MPTAPPASGLRGRAPVASLASRPSGTAPITTRRPRPSLRVDDFGDLAVAIAASVAHSSAPKLLKSRGELTDAPLDPRDAFIISLVDGTMTLPSLVDVSGMSEPEVVAILERLARLGIVSLA
jgi:hypothetical protein